MQTHLEPSSRASALAYPKATATRSYQHQRQMRTGRGNPWGTCAPVCVAGNDPQHDRSGNRAGFNGSSYAQTGGAMSRAFHCRSAAGISPHSRRPVLDTLLGIGLNSPAERIRAARGAFPFRRDLGSTPSRAQSLAHQQTVNVPADVPHIQPRLSSKSPLRPDQYGRSEKGWRYQIPVMRCPT